MPSHRYNEGNMAWSKIVTVTLAAFVACLACTPRKELPEDPDIEVFIETSSRCAYVERAFSHDDDLFKEKMAEVEIPPRWEQMVDSLLARHGAQVDLWHEVYSEISKRSRR
jgi:hypothetical protein